MRGLALIAATVGTLLCAAVPVWSSQKIAHPTAHSLSSEELWKYAIQSSDVVLLGRILKPVEFPDTLYHDPVQMDEKEYQGPRFVALNVRIEPVQYLKGGLDGDLIDARFAFGGFLRFSKRDPDSFRALAGVDTMGAIIFLRRHEHLWWFALIQTGLPPDGEPGESSRLERQLSYGYVPLPQREWASRLDQLRAWIRESPADSTGSPSSH